jgi:hypothetical protein
MSKAIEVAIRSERWKKARQLIRARLREQPDSHWLLTRLGLTYYEERAYRASLSYSRKALRSCLSVHSPCGITPEAFKCSEDNIASLSECTGGSVLGVLNKSPTETVARDAAGYAD